MNKPLAVAAASVTLLGGGGIMEHQHVEPVPSIIRGAEDVGSFVGDRVGDVVSTVENVVDNPEVHVIHGRPGAPRHSSEESTPVSAEHLTYDRLLLNLGETGLAGWLMVRLGRLALRRRWAPQADDHE